MIEFSTIICSINLTENNADIAEYTRQIAALDNSKIVLLHFAPSLGLLASYTTSGALDTMIEESSKRMDKYLNEFIEKNFKGYDVEKLVKSGDPAKAMLEVVDKYCADLIVMGSMSTKEWYSFLFSDPSEKLISQTRVPVVIVPNDLSMECLPLNNEIHLKQENPF